MLLDFFGGSPLLHEVITFLQRNIGYENEKISINLKVVPSLIPPQKLNVVQIGDRSTFQHRVTCYDNDDVMVI